MGIAEFAAAMAADVVVRAQTLGRAHDDDREAADLVDVEVTDLGICSSRHAICQTRGRDASFRGRDSAVGVARHGR